MFLVIRLLAKLISLAISLWLLGSLALFAIMWLPPSQFATIIGRVPAPLVMSVLPFRPLWNIARSGPLKPGDLAPDFDLPTVGSGEVVRLSSHHAQRPVVLVFGSYT
jgi:hypothetical protein